MAHHIVHVTACLLMYMTVIWAEQEQTRWSRQISSYTADISDWVPLPGPMEHDMPQTKRQAVAEPRILSEPFPGIPRPTGFTTHGGNFNQDSFPFRAFFNTPANRQLYLQSLPAVPSAPQNYLTEQGFGQSIRFGLSQPNFPLTQGFVAPQLNFDNIPSIKTKPQQVVLNPIKFENFPKSNPSLKPQVQTFITQAPKSKPEVPKFLDGYRVENISNDFNNRKPQSLQKLKYDGVKTETINQNKPKVEREEVQLLYVPLESLNKGQFKFRNPIPTPQTINMDLYNQVQRQFPLNTPVINNPSANFQKTTPKTVENLGLRHEFLTNGNAQISTVNQIPQFSTLLSPFPTLSPSTLKPKKLKPHQPPLAIFLTQDARKDKQVKVGDVLYSLKNANTIAVLDSINPQNAPKVFIGPSTLTLPDNYVKFELPYLSNIENSESKLRQLPFFVAPLSYNTPQGFAKIPFPSPHVGSVVINSQIQRDTQTSAHLTTLSDILPSFYPYSLPPSKQGKNLENSKPKINYYTTVSPKTKVPSRHEPNNYAFEKQTVNSLHTPKETATGLKETSYFLNNVGNQYNPSDFVNFPSGSNYQTPETVQTYTIAPIVETTSTQKPTTTTTTTTSTTSTTTTTKPSTYPSQLLETHNPYSINQAFHFSTPIDYQNFFDEYKENYSTPGNASPPQQSTINISSPTPISQETERPLPKYTNRSPNYLQGYTPEIHYDSEVQNHFFHNTNQQTVNSKDTSEYTQTENPLLQHENFQPSSDFIPPRNVNENIETEQILAHDNFETLYTTPSASSENPIPTTAPTEEYNYYETNLSTDKNQETISSTSTTTSTTRRTPLRSRGPPRYPTVKPDTGEYTTKTFATRRPLRERRPLASRPRYESNQITTEKPLKKPAESIETTTKYMRTRTRGRIHYKPSDADEIYEKRAKTQNGKENDLAYQRDVLHQNYPVTLMERMSTVDIEAITEPIVKAPSTSIRHSEDTENAYSNDKVSITEHIANVEYKDLYEYRDGQSNSQYIPNLTTTSDDDYIYKPRSSISPSDAYATFDEVKEEKTDHKLTTPVYPSKIMEVTISDNNEFLITQNNEQSVSANNEYETIKTEQTTTKTNVVNENVANQEKNRNADDEENIVQTTPSYNRVRIRPGVIRQNHQASKESHRARGERRRPGLAVTYRPAYDKRRTTMRIDEIEADLKTKQIHSRPDFQDYRHPVYKPEPTTEPTIIVTSTQEASTKRGLYRRRRPTYTTSSTEIPTNKKNTYEIKSHFRGRRPTEKQSEKPKVVTESPTATVRETSDTKYNDGTRLSERFNKNSEQEELADQDPNYSIQKSNYAKPESDRWSPKFSKDSFKPYNPNDIVDETKMQAADHSTANGPELDIITAKNEYDNILISVTPATNNRANKKIPDIPPTLEALVEQSRITKSNGSDTMSTFESMLEEVMKSLEEQDEDEYTKNVMKHKGGEIGEIPPEKIIESAENYYSKPTTSVNEITTISATSEDTTQIEQKETDRKTRRRGFWKKVKVRPSTTESIEVAESQYYSSTANRLGQPIKFSKAGLDKSEEKEKSKLKITTYKPSYQFIQELFETDNDEIEIIPDIDIPKITTVSSDQKTIMLNDSHLKTTAFTTENTSTEKLNPGELDLGTGSPDLTFAESTYFSAVTEPTTSKSYNSSAHTSDGFSLMDYLFGVTSSDSDADFKGKNETKRNQDISLEISSDLDEGKITTEQSKFKTTTETTYIPDEITAITLNNEEENEKQSSDKNKLDISKEDYFIEGTTEQSLERIETTSISSFMDSLNIISTSMSTEVSHETEICFRGKCIKTKRL
ncbi:unnamed protein product [Parnassius apollo]|uniref:(apollo) hypothetical protein n=1 Tax=Parnassius apollo TaxID=110799 RepID=A0A8S3X110_PARAO|nr:unnamed protein product [Parnassius apollo]